MRVLVLLVRGLNLGYLGCYGNEWVATPNLDRLAATGVVFDQHFADQPDDAGAAHAWQTGRYGLPLPDEPAPDAPHVFPLLAAQGVATFLIAPPSEYNGAGWQHVCELEPAAEPERLTEAAAKALDQLNSLPQWFLRLDLDSLLPPWNVPESFRERYALDLEGDEGIAAEDVAFLQRQADYAAAVSYRDEGLGRILEVFDQRCPGGDVLVLVTTNCGQVLSEGTSCDRRRRSSTRSEFTCRCSCVCRRKRRPAGVSWP
jgi:arylsulfatase A-like enzyme